MGWGLQGGVEAETAEKCNTNLQRCAYIVSIMFCSFFAFPLHLVPPGLCRSSRRRRIGKRRKETKKESAAAPQRNLGTVASFLASSETIIRNPEALAYALRNRMLFRKGKSRRKPSPLDPKNNLNDDPESLSPS